MLGWSQSELANRAGVSVSTIKNFESDKHRAITASLTVIRQELERAGIEWIEETATSGWGLRFRDPQAPVDQQFEIFADDDVAGAP